MAKHKNGIAPTPPEVRFWRHVSPEPNSGCWLWTAATRNGYGVLGVGLGPHMRIVEAHRISYQMHVGQIPEGLFICHKCDVRSCVNPAHLFLGTPYDNVRDMHTKGREARGETNGISKLTDEQVLQIRADAAAGIMQEEIAKRFGLGNQNVSCIVKGKTWTHLPLAEPPRRYRRNRKYEEQQA